MSSIDYGSVPTNAVEAKIGMITKEIYINGNNIRANINNIPENPMENILAKNNKEFVTIYKSEEKKDNYSMTVIKLKLNNDSSMIGAVVLKDIFSEDCSSGKVILDEPMTITMELKNILYCIPYSAPIQLKPMPKIDKLIDSSSFENVSTKLQEINNLLKISSDNLKTIMDANNLMYDITDNFSTLVQKLNNEPINFLLEGTKVRDILRKHMGTMIYAPDAGATYNDLMFTDSLPSDAQDLKEDLSQKQDGSILLLKKSISDGSRTYDTYYIYSNKKIYANKNSSYMFNLGVNYFSDIYFNNFYGEYIENASHLFDYVTYSNASAVYVTLNKFENVILNNLVNIDYMFNDCAIKLNRSITITNKIKTYNNFYSKFNSYQESYGSITLNYIDNESKKIAETIVSETNDSFIKLGSLVTQ